MTLRGLQPMTISALAKKKIAFSFYYDLGFK
jgi:hypothetical protein